MKSRQNLLRRWEIRMKRSRSASDWPTGSAVFSGWPVLLACWGLAETKLGNGIDWAWATQLNVFLVNSCKFSCPPFACLNGQEKRAECLPVAGRHQTVEDKVDGGVQQRQQIQHIAQCQVDEAMDVCRIDGVQNGNQALRHFSEKEDTKNCQQQCRRSVRVDSGNGEETCCF